MALARKGRQDRGERRTVSLRIKEAIEGLALERPPLPITSIYRQVSEFAKSLGEPVTGYLVVRDLVQKLPASLLMMAHQGSKAYSESFDLVHRREAARPNSVWQADHAELDNQLVREDGSTA